LFKKKSRATNIIPEGRGFHYAGIGKRTYLSLSSEMTINLNMIVAQYGSTENVTVEWFCQRNWCCHRITCRTLQQE